ncbi:MAG: hypothetical protein CL573_00710 [Alphaproteobacteria bacterium]|nr:hypothetical protein [Alphaproteobacteria bacterium]|tara:strand:- start:5738 stop:6640 length:903 start_codon:yes stop_codon:yes gene_type:complete
MTDAIRRLTDIKFEHSGAHVALVGKHQGGPANGVTTLVYKALDDVSDDIIEKATQVQVSMSFQEFLRMFFNMYWEDAEVLARALGFEGDISNEPQEFTDYINEKVAGIRILKSVYKAIDVQAAVAQLSPEETLELLQTQEVLEKAMSSAMPEGDLKIPSHPQEDTMDTIEKALHVELLEKAVKDAEDVLKAQITEQEDVIKALQTEVETFKAAQVEAVAKARKQALVDAKVAEDEVEELYKALEALPQEAFDAVVKKMAASAAVVDESELFKETGVAGSGEPDPQEQDAVAAILKAKYQK